MLVPLPTFPPIAGTYNETPEDQLLPGLYLGLFHGRRDPHQVMKRWGSNGPILGPLAYVQETYASWIKTASPDAGKDYEMISIVEDVVSFGGKYYGEWTVFYVGAGSPTRRHFAEALYVAGSRWQVIEMAPGSVKKRRSDRKSKTR